MRFRPPGIRWQLTLWYAASLVVILLLVAACFAVAFKINLDANIDSQLQAQTRQIAALISDTKGHLGYTTAPDSVTPWCRVLDAQGNVVYATPSVRGLLLNRAVSRSR